MLTRRIVPTSAGFGRLSRFPSRKKNGDCETCRIVILLIVTSSSTPPSTLIHANPWQLTNTQFEIAILRNPPTDSVPSLIRPIGPEFATNLSGTGTTNVPSSNVPTAYPLTWQFVIV